MVTVHVAAATTHSILFVRSREDLGPFIFKERKLIQIYLFPQFSFFLLFFSGVG
jgi:hypothetical protein